MNSRPKGGPTGGEPERNIGAKGPRPKDFWKTVKRLLRYVSKRMLSIIAVLVLAIAAVVFQIQIPKVLGQATTEIFKGVMKGVAEMKQGLKITSFPVGPDEIDQILLIVVAMCPISAVFSFLQQVIMTCVSQRTVYELCQELEAKVNKVPVSYYDIHNNGDIVSRTISNMDNVASTLQQNLTQLITSIMTSVGVLWIMLTISWRLILIALAAMPLSLIVVMIVASRSQKHFAAQQKNLGLLSNQVEETYGGHVVVKSFNHEESGQGIFEKESEELYRAGRRAQFVSTIIMPLMNFIKNLGYVFVAVLGGVKIANDMTDLGDARIFLQYTNQLSQPVTQVTNLMNTIQTTVASAERVFEVLDEEKIVNEPSGIPVEADSPYRASLGHVAFGYSPEKLLVKDFNLNVKPGEMVVIVDPTGTEETTLINLLKRFYDINGGSIKYDGVGTRDLSREGLRAHFSIILQDTWSFTRSTYDNIHYGDEQASEEEVVRATKAAHVDDFVKKLPEGYQAILNEGTSNISQGQRQLVTIVRAFSVNPGVLILDEATSSVDTRTEILIQATMNHLLESRTNFVVAHHLSAIRDADTIIVMAKDSIVETGTHDESMAKDGFYTDLYNSQFSGGVT